MEMEECFILKCCLALLLGGVLTVCWVLFIGLCLHLANHTQSMDTKHTQQ